MGGIVRSMFRYSAIAGLVACTTACSSAYIPQPGPRLSVVMDTGSLAYMRDGKTYEGGFLGGDIEEAVSGNPRAEAYAHEYKTGLVTGFAMSMIGIAGMLGGVSLAAADAGRSNDQSVPLTGLLIAGAGAILDLVGSAVMVSAVPHLYDAVNAFNDGVPTAARAPAPTQPAAPVASQPASSQTVAPQPEPQPAASQTVTPEASR
jgi:hypothetical protein